MKQKSKWHQIGLSLFNYQDDARSNKHNKRDSIQNFVKNRWNSQSPSI